MAWFQSSMPSLTMMVIWHQWMVFVTSVCYQTLFGRSYGTLRHVLVWGGWKVAFQPIVQMQFSYFSMKSFDDESSAEGQRTRDQRTTSSTSIFGRLRKIRFFKEKLNAIDSLVQCVKSFAEGYCHETISWVRKNVLKRATLCLKAGGGYFQYLL